VDTITHGIAGALVGKSFLSDRTDRLATRAITLGAVLPDADFLANFFSNDPLIHAEFHRSITHSFVMLPVWAMLLGALTSRWDVRRRWLLLSGLYGLGIALHILLDLITSYGTLILSPLSRERFALDITFFADLTLTAIVLLPQLLAWIYSPPEQGQAVPGGQTLHRGMIAWVSLALAGGGAAWLALALQLPLPPGAVATGLALIAILFLVPYIRGVGFKISRAAYCRAGVVALAAYLGLCSLAHERALARVDAFGHSLGAPVERRAALPAPPSLVWWSGLVETPTGIYRIALHLFDPAPPVYRFFPNAEKNFYLQKAGEFPDTQTFLWFARFPWVTYREENGVHVVQYTDLQFMGIRRDRNRPWTFSVSMDDEGQVVGSTLIRR
jgi:membrane-bound metal-dependent hydrolase YbcI (DUF457 family)